MEREKRCIGYIIVCITNWEGQSEQFMSEKYTGYDGEQELSFDTWGRYADEAPRIYHVGEVKAALETARKYWSEIQNGTRFSNETYDPYPIEAREVWA